MDGIIRMPVMEFIWAILFVPYGIYLDELKYFVKFQNFVFLIRSVEQKTNLRLFLTVNVLNYG